MSLPTLPPLEELLLTELDDLWKLKAKIAARIRSGITIEVERTSTRESWLPMYLDEPIAALK